MKKTKLKFLIGGCLAMMALLAVGPVLAQGTPNACRSNPNCVLITQDQNGDLHANPDTVTGNNQRPVLFFFWTGSPDGALDIQMKDQSRSPFDGGKTTVPLTFDAWVKKRARRVTTREQHNYNVVNTATGKVLDPIIVIDP